MGIVAFPHGRRQKERIVGLVKNDGWENVAFYFFHKTIYSILIESQIIRIIAAQNNISRSKSRIRRSSKIICLHLLQICLVYINTLLVQKVLAEKDWLDKMQPEDFRGFTPLFYGHVNPYGRLVLDMNERIII